MLLQRFLLPGSSSDAGKRRSSQGHTKVKFGFSLVKGKVNHPMEDYHVAKFVQMRGQELGLFAIFDGHMGHSVPAYLQKHLFTNILKEEEFWTNPELAIRKAYEKTDEAILSHRPDLGRGGSTAVTAILINGRKLWIANIGDSRAVLAKGQQVLQLTVDHDPSTERRSIENRGGFVSIMPGDVPRVNGQLAVSRAFGDKDLKRHLRSDPDVRCVDVAADTDLLILASDGIWKVMSNKEAIEIARKATDPQAAARQLTTAALERDSTDDISCIVIQLQV
ncbi:Stage II sporulation protein E (SpoIIE) [Musa troglodytarum]|uniref:protein-serine/threonine phosphatase n=1 Tax=Musa troglodytarum TaxID=320322 RepID=A0A9E7L358_9LILI|nr:Stage II sporulation protein E (SpoIIE) [Musa troglodytarum]